MNISKKIALGLLISSITPATFAIDKAFLKCVPGFENFEGTPKQATQLVSRPDAVRHVRNLPELNRPDAHSVLAAVNVAPKAPAAVIADKAAAIDEAVRNGSFGLVDHDGLTADVLQKISFLHDAGHDVTDARTIAAIQDPIISELVLTHPLFMKSQVQAFQELKAVRDGTGVNLTVNDTLPVVVKVKLANIGYQAAEINADREEAFVQLEKGELAGGGNAHVKIDNPQKIDVETLLAFSARGEDNPALNDFNLIKNLSLALKSNPETSKTDINNEIIEIALNLSPLSGDESFDKLVILSYYIEHELGYPAIALNADNKLTPNSKIRLDHVSKALGELERLNLIRETGNVLIDIIPAQADAAMEILANKVKLLGSDREITTSDIDVVSRFRADERLARPSTLPFYTVPLYTTSLTENTDAWGNPDAPTVVELMGLSRLTDAQVNKAHISPEITDFVGNLPDADALDENVKGALLLMNNQLGQNPLAAPSLNQVRAAGLAVAAPDVGLVEAVAAVMQRAEAAHPGANYVPRFSAKILNLDDGHGKAVIEITQLTNNPFTADAARIDVNHVAIIESADLVAAAAGIKAGDYIFGDDVINHAAANQVELTNLVSLIK
ncbi:MAG: hypothetical protein FJX03_06970 [Alphaproteobacteria bacterium]|nr:hypothetical protein [Alphaproteobacteria bacterium]